MAHPDDAELWAGGTLALHARVSRSSILVATSDMKRHSEAIAGAKCLGADVEVVEALTEINCMSAMEKCCPDILIMHRVDDVHPAHRKAAEIVLACVPEVVIATGKPKRLYMCDSYESVTLSGNVEGRTVVDVTTTFDTKLSALRSHQSQNLLHFEAMAKRMAAFWGGRIGVPWAEAFDSVPVLGRVPGVVHL